MRTTKTGQIDRRSATAAAQAAAIGPEGRTARAKAGAAARWNHGQVTMTLVVSSIEQARSICRRLNRKFWAVTPDDAEHRFGTFRVGISPEIIGTWRVE